MTRYVFPSGIASSGIVPPYPKFSLMLRMLLVASGLACFAISGCGSNYPNCDDDDDCVRDEDDDVSSGAQKEYCVNGKCQQCRSTADCPAGRQCVGGRCDVIPGYCRSKGDCAGDEECRGNRCVAVARSSEATDPSAATGQEGECEQLESIYFDFDSDAIREADRKKLEQNAQCIREKAIASVQVTGHTDPRGTEEYNLALGDRRARAVAGYLKSLGVEAGKVSSNSVGEEMASGTDESSWAQDRKAEFQPR